MHRLRGQSHDSPVTPHEERRRRRWDSFNQMLVLISPILWVLCLLFKHGVIRF